MLLRKIISGGQIGADQAGLFAAEQLGLTTGGWAPRGFRTDDGPMYDLGPRFKLIEHSSSNYQPRTYSNVLVSDATVLFGRDSPGYRLTAKYANNLIRPIYPVMYPIHNITFYDASFRAWLNENAIVVLNVAGNRESTNPGITKFVFDFLVRNLTERSS
jgi:hypothetical protein